jgi:uncharacterized protein (TIGR00266 family)
MEHQILGTTLPVLEITLQPGEKITSVSGELSWMSSSINMHTSTQMGSTGGFGGLLGRLAGGGSLFYTEYTAVGQVGLVAFAAKMPGHIIDVPVSPGDYYVVHRTGFVCGTSGIEVGASFQQNLGAGVFGGNGFIMQKISGNGHAFVELSGELVNYDLAPGEVFNVHPGHVGMLSHTVSFELTRIKGIRNMLFGGDDIFLAKLTGPGRIWLQSMPIVNLAHALIPYLPSRGG